MNAPIDFEGLTVSQRLDLIAKIWDSIPESDEAVPAWHLEELNRRLATADADPSAAVSWHEAKARLERPV
jgi:putative addiction module component (TIGR02574 family)